MKRSAMMTLTICLVSALFLFLTDGALFAQEEQGENETGELRKSEEALRKQIEEMRRQLHELIEENLKAADKEVEEVIQKAGEQSLELADYSLTALKKVKEEIDEKRETLNKANERIEQKKRVLDEAKQRIEAKKDDLDEVKKKITEKKRAQDDAKREIDESWQTMSDVERLKARWKIDAKKESLEHARWRIDDLKDSLEEVKSRIDDAKDTLEEAKSRIDEEKHMLDEAKHRVDEARRRAEQRIEHYEKNLERLTSRLAEKFPGLGAPHIAVELKEQELEDVVLSRGNAGLVTLLRFEKARVCREVGMLDEAAQEFRKIIDQNVSEITTHAAWLAFVEILLEQKKNQEAIAELEKIITDPALSSRAKRDAIYGIINLSGEDAESKIRTIERLLEKLMETPAPEMPPAKDVQAPSSTSEQPAEAAP